MLCLIPGGVFILAAYAMFAGICWPLITRILDAIWTVGVIGGRALAVTLLVLVANLVVAFAVWFTLLTGRLVRQWRDRHGKAPLCQMPLPGGGTIPCPLEGKCDVTRHLAPIPAAPTEHERIP